MGIYISTSLHQKLRDYVKWKYGEKMYGISQEVEQALITHLEKRINDQDGKKYFGTCDIKDFQKTNRVWNLKRKIRFYLVSKFKIDDLELEIITIEDLRDAIRSVCGIDKRTFDSNFQALKDAGCINVLKDGSIDIS